MNIHWLLPIDQRSTESLTKSNLASVRLRAGPVLRLAKSAGMSISFGETVPSKTNILIVGKIGGDADGIRVRHWLNQIKVSQKSGARIVVDYTDHHLVRNGVMGHFYRELLPVVDSFVVPSAQMIRNLEPFWSGTTTVIHDAVEYDFCPPKARGGAQITGLWFGHSSNLPYLSEWLGASRSFDFELLLNVVTDQQGVNSLKKNGLFMPSLWRAQAYVWSPGVLKAVASNSDFCVIPCNPSDPKKSGASSNRLLTALSFGLPVVANKLPAYLEFSEYFTNLDNLNWPKFLDSIEEQFPAVRTAQDSVLPRYSFNYIGRRWFILFEQLVKQRIPALIM